MSLFDDLNAEIGRNTSFSKRSKMRLAAAASKNGIVRYFDRKFAADIKGGSEETHKQ